jgi:PAS domain S-box-containing protein
MEGFVMAEKPTYDELVQRVKTLENEAVEHTKAEEGLRENEKRYRLLVERMSDGLAIYDENGLNTYNNDRFCQMLGYSSDEILGRPVSDFLDEAQVKIVEEQIGKRKMGKREPYELEWTRKDGEKISTIISPSPILDDEDRYGGAFAVVTDISELKKTQKELEESLSLFSATLDSTADGILVVDREGKIVSFNNRFVEMWRISDSIIETGESDQAVAFVLDQLKDPESFLKKVRELYSRPDDESFDVLEFKDERIFERYSQPQMIKGKSVGRVWSFRDVTDRKQAEEALQESEARYRILFENASEAIYVAQDGMIKFHNPRTEELCGYSKEELSSQPFTYFIHEEDRKMVLDRHKRRLEGETLRTNYPFRIVNKSGDTKWVELKVAEIHWDKRPAILCFMTDIDVRIQAEKALKESEEKYRTILENVVDGYYEVNLAGYLTFVNDSLCKMTGYTRDELIGMNNREYMDEENTKLVYKVFSRVYETGNSVKGFEHEIIQPKDASKRGVESSVALIRDAEGQPAGFRGVLRDVTERKQAEQLLRESKESLDRAQKLVHIGNWSRDLGTDHGEWSDEMYRILGLTPGNPKHPTHEEFLSRVHPVERENIARGFKEAVKTKRPFEYEFRTVPIEGLEKIIHVRGKVECDDTGVPIPKFKAPDLGQIKV